MAIDTANKRASAGNLLGLETLPGPDTSIGLADRMQVAGFYSGISAATGMIWEFVGRIFAYVAANWLDVDVYLESTLKAITGTVYARLYDMTSSTDVPGSEVSTADTTPDRVRSGAISLTDGHEYRGQWGAEAPAEGLGYGITIVFVG